MMEEQSKFGLKSSRASRVFCTRHVISFNVTSCTDFFMFDVITCTHLSLESLSCWFFFRARPAVTREFCGLISSTASCKAPVQKQAELNPFQIKCLDQFTSGWVLIQNPLWLYLGFYVHFHVPGKRWIIQPVTFGW